MHNLLNPSSFIKDYGYVGVFIVVLLESGIIFGFFLPGDSLLFAAGLLASQHYLNIVGLIAVSILGAVIGNNAGYYTGKKLGETIFTRKKSFFFSHKRVTEAHTFFQKEGGQSLILARFIPAVRTFVPIIAGVAEMDYKTFFAFNTVGGVLWGILVPILGFTLGKTVHNIDKYLIPIIILIAIVSALPVIIKYLKDKKKVTS